MAARTFEEIEAQIKADAERRIEQAREKWEAEKGLREERDRLTADNDRLTARVHANTKRLNEISRALGEQAATRRRRSAGTRTSASDGPAIDLVRTYLQTTARGDGANAVEIAEGIEGKVSAQTVRRILNGLVESNAVTKTGIKRGTKFYAKAHAPKS